jgi:N6-L-threonylcarbamoyladenine synthase
VYERSEFLEVPAGKRGLRQSEAFFHHSNRLPDYIDGVFGKAEPESISAVGVSTRPRRVEGSYMPCFLAGYNAAREIASALGVPLYEFSHQEGHAAAIIEDRSNGWTAKDDRDHTGRSLFFHLSGGTTEFLLCRRDPEGYELTITGGTRDISIGQFFDRIGVAMGFPFPAGSYLDRAAVEFITECPVTADHLRNSISRIRLSDGYFNLSGHETYMMRLIEAADPDEYPWAAYEMFDKTADLLASAASDLAQKHSVNRVYMAGGVSSSTFIRQSILSRLERRKSPVEIVFGPPELSGDNAVGIARLARRLSADNPK